MFTILLPCGANASGQRQAPSGILLLPQTEQGPGYGGAMLAMVACGEYATAAEACKALIKIAGTVEPDAALTARYEAQYQKFKQIYPAVKGLFLALQ